MKFSLKFSLKTVIEIFTRQNFMKVSISIQDASLTSGDGRSCTDGSYNITLTDFI